ncbi:MAG TPA: response regulator transcription factor [Anaerolineae bacterium]|nr:response regulator transcription factor [Anaerolineae bacterium]
MPIRVIVVDDQELVREGLAIILDAQPDIEVVGQAADGQEAVALASRLHPDVVLMDIKMPRLDGIAATREIKRRQLAVQILILTTYSEDELVFEGIRAGASGYLLKDITRAELAEAVRGAAQGEAQIDPAVASQVLAEFQRMAGVLARRGAPPSTGRQTAAERAGALDELPPVEKLTPREESILELLTEGLTNAGIAARLHLSEGTVKNYVSEILAKLQANDRTHAVVLAIRRGLLELD